MQTIHQVTVQQEAVNRQRLMKNLLDLCYLSKKQQESILVRYKLNLPKFNVLQILSSHHPDSLSQIEIVERITDKTLDMPRIIKKLIELRYVSRKRNRLNKRETEITITPLGLETLMEINSHSAQMYAAISAITDDEVIQMSKAVSKMKAAVIHSAVSD